MSSSKDLPEAAARRISPSRLTSIDAVRGFAMLWIIGGSRVVKTLSTVWPNPTTEMLSRQMTHAGWEGFHFIDWIAPLFLFVVGVTLPFSILRRLEEGVGVKQLYLRVVRRTALLILLGLINYGLLRFDWAEMRWSSTLGRIGICYFCAALLLIHANWKTEAILVGVILVGFWAAVTLIPVPGFGPGILTPEACLTTYLDQMLIPGKLGLGLYDRQGVLSTFTALATTLMGVLAGRWLRSSRSGNRKVAGLVAAGVVSLAAGWAWGKLFFISRNIWTSSFALYTAGLSLLTLALFYWMIDLRGWKRWSFFLVVIGMNAITIWVGQRMVDFDYTARFLVMGAARNLGAIQPLVVALSVLMVKWVLLWFLYRHRVFLRA